MLQITILHILFPAELGWKVRARVCGPWVGWNRAPGSSDPTARTARCSHCSQNSAPFIIQLLELSQPFLPRGGEASGVLVGLVYSFSQGRRDG